MPAPDGTPTPGQTSRGLRDHPLGKLAILLGVLLLALLVSRSCGRTEAELSREEAIAIAERQIDYEPDRTQIRLLKRGFQSREFWAVSLATLRADGSYDRITVVVVDATTGEVAEVRVQAGA